VLALSRFARSRAATIASRDRRSPKVIILISDAAEELIGMADRILLFRGDRIAASGSPTSIA
jgi:ABC-type sugar transport system ATPase subunit